MAPGTPISSLRCPCGGEYGHVLAMEASYRIVRCVRCQLVATDPRTVSTESDYGHDYFAKNYLERMEPWRRSHSYWFRRVVAPLVAGNQRPRILDVGCGIGLFLSVVPPSWERVGVEPSKNACAMAKEQFGLDVRPQLLEELPADGGYDVVTFWDVVEHLPDPIATLRAAHRHVKPGGRLVVKVPDISPAALKAGALLARARKGSVVFHIGAHLYQFDEKTLRSTLVSAGLVPERLESHSSPYGVRAFFMKGRLSGRIARLGMHLGGLARSVIAVNRVRDDR